MAVRAFGTRRGRNKERWLLAGFLMATTALIVTPKAEAAGTLTPSYYDEILGMSANGSIYIGNIYNNHFGATEAFVERLSPSVAYIRLPSLGGDGFNSYITAINGAGTAAVGYGQNADGRYRAWRMLANFGAATHYSQVQLTDLGTLFPNNPLAQSYAHAVSGDGTRVVGRTTENGMERAFAWIEGSHLGVIDNEQMHRLTALPGGNGQTAAYGISDDGRYAVGYSDADANTGLAVRWDLTGLTNGQGVLAQNLGSLTGMGGSSEARAASANGSVIVGVSADVDGRDRAFRWKEGATNGVIDNVEMLDMGTLGGQESWARAITRDGVWAVGSSTTVDDYEIAFRWSEETGMESVADWLLRHEVDLGDNWLETAASISDDGRVVGGRMVYEDANGDQQTRSYLARVQGDNGPSGIMDVAEYNGTLYSAAGIANVGEYLTWLPMNGAHHRPLMLTPNLSGDMCAWATGDFAHHSGSSTNLALAEAGACVDLAGGSVRLGGAIGTTASWQTLSLGGAVNMAGQYVLGEMDWQPDGTPLLLSVTGMLGGWGAKIDRAYSNGGATAVSSGQTNAMGGVVRVRADWLEAAVIGNTSFNPWASVSFGALHVDGYAESGGPFPARFAAQNLGHADMRIGVTAVTEFTSQTKLSTTLELAHRTGTAASAVGQVDGLFSFSLGGGTYGQTWGRLGLELDHKVSDAVALSGSVHLATNGRDPSVAISAGIKGAF